MVVVFVASRNDYKKTYVAAYTESEGTRLRLADHLRKLPMSFFNRRDTTDVADRIMGDVTAQESHALVDAPAAHRRNRVDRGHLFDAGILRLAARLLRYGHASRLRQGSSP